MIPITSIVALCVINYHQTLKTYNYCYLLCIYCNKLISVGGSYYLMWQVFIKSSQNNCCCSSNVYIGNSNPSIKFIAAEERWTKAELLEAASITCLGVLSSVTTTTISASAAIVVVGHESIHNKLCRSRQVTVLLVNLKQLKLRQLLDSHGLNRAYLEMVQPVECLVAPLALGPAAVGVHPGVPPQLVVSEHSEVLLPT